MIKRKMEGRELARKELFRTSEQLCFGDDCSGLGIVLRDLLPGLQCAFILRWLPEQAEDIYWVLTGPIEIVKIEIPRIREGADETASLKVINLATFRKSILSREVRDRLEIALELIRA